MTPRWAAVPFGAAFGFLLSWGGMTDREAIRAMLLLRSWDIFLMMGLAMGVGMAGAHLLRAAKVRSLLGGEPISWSRTRPGSHHVVGSALFGLGWSIACTCPGPIAAQVGAGRLPAVLLLAGVLGGVALRGWQQQRKKVAPAPATAAVTAGL